MEQIVDDRSPAVHDSGSAGPAAPHVPGYRLGRKLGTGGNASVWLATSERSGAIFAAKIINPSGNNHGAVAAANEHARREMQLLDRVGHEHLMQLHEVVAIDGAAALIITYAAGGSLAELVSARGPLPVGEVVTILTPIAQCLAYLHNRGVCHSDVSPGNILFSELGKPLLSDLGLGRRTGESGTSTEGTAGFAAPDHESDRRKEGLSPEDDVHGLAAVGWYALTGRVPAPTDRRPPLSIVVPDVPEELAAIIEAGLEENTGTRPTAAEFERAAYNSCGAAAIDLVPAVHESVLPHLVTRRNLPRRKRKRQLLAYKRKPRSARAAAKRPQWRLPAAVAASVAAVLIAWGLLGSSPSGTSTGPAAGTDAGMSSAVPAAGTSATSPKSPGNTDGGAGAATSRTPEPAPEADREMEARLWSAVPGDVREGLSENSPGEAVHALAWMRSYAFSSGQTALLDHVNVPGSPAMAADARIADRLERTGHVLAGFETDIVRAEPLRTDDSNWPVGVKVATDPSSDPAVLAVTAHTSGFTEMNGQGEAVHRQEPAGGQQLRMVLRKVDGHWQIAEILAPAATG